MLFPISSVPGICSHAQCDRFRNELSPRGVCVPQRWWKRLVAEKLLGDLLPGEALTNPFLLKYTWTFRMVQNVATYMIEDNYTKESHCKFATFSAIILSHLPIHHPLQQSHGSLRMIVRSAVCLCSYLRGDIQQGHKGHIYSLGSTVCIN